METILYAFVAHINGTGMPFCNAEIDGFLRESGAEIVIAYNGVCAL
jgi:hypothetical protein